MSAIHTFEASRSPLLSRAVAHMTSGGSVLICLIDHANFQTQSLDLRALITEWYRRIEPSLADGGIVQVVLRAYGGWFRDFDTTEERFRAAQFYQDSTPAMVRCGRRILHVGFEFADTLLLWTSKGHSNNINHRITHTVALRTTPIMYTRVRDFACGVSGCAHGQFKRALQMRRACVHPNCEHQFGEALIRLEQKQVDTHIVTDALLVAQMGQLRLHLAVASNDWDMLPCLLATASVAQQIGSTSAIRTSCTPTYLDPALAAAGVHIVRLPESETPK